MCLHREAGATGFSGRDRDVVTEIAPIKNFFPAEKYHQNYFNDNPRQQYCEFVIRPKVEKFNKDFKDLLKPSAPAK